MRDPLVVAHVIVRPWPQRSTFSATGSRGDGVRWQVRHKHPVHDGCPTADCAGPDAFPWWKPLSYSRFWRLAGRDWFWPALVTIWHREPGRDSGEVCLHNRRIWNDAERKWEYRLARSWRWHVHHFRVQLHPAQGLRRRLLTRCSWCGGRQRKNDPVNIGHSWDGIKSPWWRGERGLFHHDCSSVEHAAGMCLCVRPLLRSGTLFGTCMECGLFRRYGEGPDDADRLLASLPRGSRITPELRPRIDALWAERRARKLAAEAAAGGEQPG
jgi:hypothetical protein